MASDGFHLSDPTIVQQLACTNDTNGNPRRVYVGWDSDGRIVAAQDENYSGPPPWHRAARANLGRVEITASEYRDWLRRIANATGRYAIVDETGYTWGRYDSRSAARRAIAPGAVVRVVDLDTVAPTFSD